MIKTRLTKYEKDKIFNMRRKGCTLTEILKEVPRSKSIVFSYMNKVEVMEDHRELLEQKQCGSKCMAKTYWDWSKTESLKFANNLSDREKILLLASLYWGEGRKTGEFGIINSDPYVINVAMEGLLLVGIDKTRLRIGLRIFEDLNLVKVTAFWSEFLKIDENFLEPLKLFKVKSMDDCSMACAD